MCGRFGITVEASAIRDRFDAVLDTDKRCPAPKYNAAPGQALCVVVSDPAAGRRIATLPWGITGPSGPDRVSQPRLINARAETADTKPTFRAAFRTRRCLIPANGFYEWPHAAGRRRAPPIPHLIRLRDSQLFGFAGLWFESASGNHRSVGFVILTCAANSLVGRLHHRMPVILQPDHEAIWLDLSSPVNPLTACLIPYPVDAMTMDPVSPRVNRTDWDGPQCFEPQDRQPTLFDTR